MNQSTADILALCNEMLLAILNRLDNMDVLYSLIGVNRKLDRLAQDITFTQSVDLVTILSNERNDSRNINKERGENGSSLLENVSEVYVGY